MSFRGNKGCSKGGSFQMEAQIEESWINIIELISCLSFSSVDCSLSIVDCFTFVVVRSKSERLSPKRLLTSSKLTYSPSSTVSLFDFTHKVILWSQSRYTCSAEETLRSWRSYGHSAKQKPQAVTLLLHSGVSCYRGYLSDPRLRQADCHMAIMAEGA